MLARRLLSISGLFLNINLLIYYAKEKYNIYDKETSRELRRRIAHIILIIKSMRRLFPIFLNKYFTFF